MREEKAVAREEVAGLHGWRRQRGARKGARGGTAGRQDARGGAACYNFPREVGQTAAGHGSDATP